MVGLDRLPPEAASRLRLTAGLGYPVLVKALRQCRIVLTDSGGIQEEAATLGLPVVIMRESTERQELVDAGGGVLVGTDGARILAHCGALLSDASARDAMKLSTNPFGDGLSSQRIARTLDQALEIKNTQIVEELSLPPIKIHCSVLAEDAIKAAINDYIKKNDSNGGEQK